jgi:hypothetical protein
VYGGGINHEEARVLIQEAAKFMALTPQQSLGIVAVNSKQAELIRELMDELCAVDPNAEAYRVKWAAGLESSFVKNLENVQAMSATCMSWVLSQTQGSFERSLAKITLADLVGQIRKKTHRVFLISICADNKNNTSGELREW